MHASASASPSVSGKRCSGVRNKSFTATSNVNTHCRQATGGMVRCGGASRGFLIAGFICFSIINFNMLSGHTGSPRHTQMRACYAALAHNRTVLVETPTTEGIRIKLYLVQQLAIFDMDAA